ncbi:glycosyltransferase family 2 protein [Fulvivirga maritima]|uniref:glycosyltransferase family A protein n=1 Tax=Fulvivirga maritima TaxID=2904247 RepID=UPI001F1A454F|nr:glycosyltransferase family A protein [Fulvivirga maritima]UII27564.1 glycosyltransferase family 2 protein [Fulvivirga maritima]
MDKIDFPLISCVCVTDHRIQYLRRSISCFLGQSYPNKEMVIVCRESDNETIEYVNQFNDEQFVLVKLEAEHNIKLGELRNISIQNANGKYFCQWDDDDWYHRDRLLKQFKAAEENIHPVSMLTNIIMFDEEEKQAYFSGFRLWENTVFGLRSLIDDCKYETLERSEDYEFMNTLLMRSKVFPTVANNLYIYVCHGTNTWNKDHFDMLFGYAQKLPSNISKNVEKILSSDYDYSEASDWLDSIEYRDSLNYFSARGHNLLKEKEVQIAMQAAFEHVENHNLSEITLLSSSSTDTSILPDISKDSVVQYGAALQDALLFLDKSPVKRANVVLLLGEAIKLIVEGFTDKNSYAVSTWKKAPMRQIAIDVGYDLSVANQILKLEFARDLVTIFEFNEDEVFYSELLKRIKSKISENVEKIEIDIVITHNKKAIKLTSISEREKLPVKGASLKESLNNFYDYP